MKKYFFTCLLLISYCAVFGQTSSQSNNLIGQSFITKTGIVVFPYDPVSGSYDKSIHFLINDDTKFYVYKVHKEGYIISVWDFSYTYKKTIRTDSSKVVKYINKNDFYQRLKPDTDLNKHLPDMDEYYKMTKVQVALLPDTPKIGNSPLIKYDKLAYVDSWANNMQFFIPLEDFNDNCESIYPKNNSFTWGFLSLPIKVRFGNASGPFTVEEKVNFGISLGYKHQYVSKIYRASNILGGVSIGSVKVNNQSDPTITSASALSFSGGYMFQYDKFQAGIFTGLDYAYSAPGWAYQGKPWIGFAIGVSLFGESKTSASNDQSQAAQK
ncbi:hypothetical protein BDD43_4470 [Mucilaginibacter gracilis]|uniref:Outer membrane protein with beta-barrel domain n=1 Tax=Mucilaginibacter gracilis TaxID=423350 RepID=A0A495J5H6_9SPHI|nr:hypothetical protein [Mucilaginibacter gracilis]RKR84240.1 hypothetical protein BDD43_4470 [Mucilaginibacter gracilis]